MTIMAATVLRNQVLMKNLMILVMIFQQINQVQVKKLAQNIVLHVNMAPEEDLHKVT